MGSDEGDKPYIPQNTSDPNFPIYIQAYFEETKKNGLSSLNFP